MPPFEYYIKFVVQLEPLIHRHNSDIWSGLLYRRVIAGPVKHVQASTQAVGLLVGLCKATRVCNPTQMLHLTCTVF